METTENRCPSCGAKLRTNAPQGLCPECLIKAGFPSGAAPRPGDPTRRPAFVPPSIEELKGLFPQLEILQLLGHGGMGAVYKARQPALDRFVALKILPPQPESDTGFAERFNREARALAKLSHPNIVAVHDFGIAGSLHFFLMEFVEGGNLRELQESGRFSPKEALRIVPQICEALQYAHDEGIVHRDIKPENVMLDRRGRVKITDFGLAKITGLDAGSLRLTGARDVMGTPHYMAPEQIEHPQEVDHRADIYSLGVVFYELLTGELPLGRFAPPSRKVQVDVRLDEVVLHTLEKEPRRRYQHASEVKCDVEEIANGKPAEAGRHAGRPGGTGAVAARAWQRFWPESSLERAVLASRWVARVFSTLLLVFYAVFMVAEGLPAIGTQPTGVQLGFMALGLMSLGFVLGWKREGSAAVLIALSWVLWNGIQGGPSWNVFQTPLPVAALYGFCWWATRGRRTGRIVAWAVVLAAVFVSVRLFIPANVFLRGRVTEAGTGLPVRGAELFLASASAHEKESGPQARSRSKGEYDLYVGWFSGGGPLMIRAPGYATLTTNLGTRRLGQKNVSRDFVLEPLVTGEFSTAEIPPVVLQTYPESGADGVDPFLSELKVTFSKPMADGCWSWVKLDESSYPQTTGTPKFSPDRRICTLPVRLQPGRTYAVWLNVDSFKNFQSADGVPSLPYLLVFKTRTEL